MSEKLIATAIIMVCATLLTLARRWNNDDNDAGIGVAGWSMFIILIMWMN